MSLIPKSRPILFLSIIPALQLGTYTMALSEVQRTLRMMNLGFGLIGIAFQWVFFRFRPVFKNANPYPVILVSMVLLLLTFLDDGYQNVHRWVSFGNFPVMVMGYGISPITGYFNGLIWLGEVIDS